MPRYQSTETPWGASDHESVKAEGIIWYSTPSHGGFWLNAERRKLFSEALPDFRPWAGAGWFEEDCDAAVIAIVFPDVFSAGEIYDAIRTARSQVGRLPCQWDSVVKLIESSEFLLRIESQERERTEALWEVGSMSGGAFIPEYDRYWCVTFMRGKERRNLMVPRYPDKQWYSDDDLAAFEPFDGAKHYRRRVPVNA